MRDNKVSFQFFFPCVFCLGWMLVSSCGGNQKETVEAIKFKRISSDHSNIKFSNTITESDSVNLLINPYAYLGSGVGIGDFNNDGLPDIYMGANQQSSKLYINKGDFVFDDVTEQAAVGTDLWTTGVSVADVNGDGLDDIYVCSSIAAKPENRKNKLFINQGSLRFSEMSEVYGLDDTSYSTQAVFFDYDRDGDLDMYLVNHAMDHNFSNNIVPRNLSGKAVARDKLYRNNGVDKKTGSPKFEDVSFSSGIIEDGYGLGIVVSDIDGDGWPDIYVANDYLANDLLWRNNGNGTFTNVIAKVMMHQSYSSMGVDAADINNDGYLDIMSLDMLPEENYRHKMMYSFLNYDRHVMEMSAGYQPQYMRNMLQLNNGLRREHDTVLPFFSEIGQLAGVSETDWSWSVLMADFDNDGYRDIHVTNGLGRDMINSDFINYYASNARNAAVDYKRWYADVLKKLNEYGTVELNNYLYRNNGDLTFSNISKDAGIDEPSISNGCAYVDLDNDGHLDLVVNNINKEAFVFQNTSPSQKDTSNHYVRILLQGNSSNTRGVGAKVELFSGAHVQVSEQQPVRGYLSSVDSRILFGLRHDSAIDSIRITWPDQTVQVLKDVEKNKDVLVKHSDAVQKSQTLSRQNPGIFTSVADSLKIDFKHSEKFYYDYGFQQMLPQKFSNLGPFVAEGDLNGDQLDDFFVGGAKGQAGMVFIQLQDGTFASKKIDSANKQQEHLGCVIFDVDGDGDNDILVNSGSNEEAPGSALYLPMLYLNDGKANFTLARDAIPASISTSAQCLAVADYDGDGDLDVFIGGRIVPRQYPLIPESYLLENIGGRFQVVTEEVAPDVQRAGMITSAVWTDFDGDKKPDLVVAGEWMSIRFFRNNGKTLEEVTQSTGVADLKGQWRSLAAADVDKDGDIDFIVGNIGTNNRYKTSEKYPMKMYATDFDGNGTVDPVMAYYRIDADGSRKLFAAITREQFASQVPLIKKKFLYNHDYAVSNMDKVLEGADKESLLEFTCSETRTGWLENRGDGEFVFHPLTAAAQFAPVNAIEVIDVDSDGNPDLVLAGNEYQMEVMTGRYDASYGMVLKGDGRGKFTHVNPANSNLVIDGDVKDLASIRLKNGSRLLLAAVNDEKLKVFLIDKNGK